MFKLGNTSFEINTKTRETAFFIGRVLSFV